MIKHCVYLVACSPSYAAYNFESSYSLGQQSSFIRTAFYPPRTLRYTVAKDRLRTGYP